MQQSLFSQAQRFVGIKEIAGAVDNPHIMVMLKLDNAWPSNDEVPWCSGFANYVCWLHNAPRSKDLRARSWLALGRRVELEDARAGFDVVVLKRGKGPQPGPEVTDAPGHVGFYAGQQGKFVEVLGGNQGDTVKVSRYPVRNILSIRRLI